ncbi:hypothetical protein AVEN_83408-1 [Araneus ventricosus]|uniref:Uncharacterized protein n=1 Tax=Araneus ventricosus TaxID=182803 RepID=A0A4Y2WEW1_ARAVE|nr:hypothetical protein AVEN_83408-1 [Araneus ventricosus]
MKSGDLLVESSSLQQSEQLSSITKFGDIPFTVSAHASLNYTRGVMSSDEFLMVSDSEFVSELEAQKVIATRRISLKRDGQIIPTRHVILTFDTPILQKKLLPVISVVISDLTYQILLAASNVSDLGTLKLHAVDHLLSVPVVLNGYMKKQFVKVLKNVLIESRKIVHDRTPKTNHSYSAALKTIKIPDTTLEPIQTPTDTTDPKPSTSAAKNEETITVKLSDWLALLKAHKISLEKKKKQLTENRNFSN